MLYNDEYQYFLKELLKRKTQPYRMANRPLADELFKRFKGEYPGASIHYYDIAQFICMDQRARRNLVKLLKAQEERQAAELQATKDLITTLVESEGAKW